MRQAFVGACQHFVLNCLQLFADCRNENVHVFKVLPAVPVDFNAVAEHNGVLFQILGTDFHNQRRAFARPFPHLVDRFFRAVVQPDANFFTGKRLGLECIAQLFRIGIDGFGFALVLDNRHDNHLLRCEFRRNAHSLVVGVRHNQSADKPGRNAPRRRIGIFLRIVGVNELDIRRLGKVLPEEVRRACLQRPSVLHHRFNAVGCNRAREFVVFRLFAFNHRHRHIVDAQIFINAEHRFGFFFRFLKRCMSGMPFLPQKFAGAQKQARAHFPAHNVRPLVNHDRQVAVRMYPLGKRVGNNGF